MHMYVRPVAKVRGGFGDITLRSSFIGGSVFSLAVIGVVLKMAESTSMTSFGSDV